MCDRSVVSHRIELSTCSRHSVNCSSECIIPRRCCRTSGFRWLIIPLPLGMRPRRRGDHLTVSLASTHVIHTHLHTRHASPMSVYQVIIAAPLAHIYTSFSHLSLSLFLSVCLSLFLGCHAKWHCYLSLLGNTVLLPSHINCCLYIMHPSIASLINVFFPSASSCLSNQSKDCVGWGAF